MINVEQLTGIPLTERERIEVRNPVTDEVLGSIPVANSEDVRAAVQRARQAQPGWAAIGARERARLLSQWGDLIWAEQDALIRTIRQETGKNEAGAFGEIFGIDALVRYYARNAPSMLLPQRRTALLPLIQRVRVYYKPHGVVGAITPWNYPFYNALVDALPALFAGNTIVLKPSEIAPFTAMQAVALLYRAGIPEHVVQIVTGDGRVGREVVDLVDSVSFTGSSATGRKIAVRCAERMIPYSLELGGNNALIVLKDANLDLAASGTLRAVLENAGQVCINAGRIFVEAPVYDAFLERLLHYAGKIKIGSGSGLQVNMGSLTTVRELERTEAHIQDALAKGARLLHGGKRRPDLGPLFFEPAILVDVRPDMEVMQEETFGPVIPIMRVRDEREALALANDSQYGLSANVFTRDLTLGEQLAVRLDTGVVNLNRPHVEGGTHSAPWGGQKFSGVARRGGIEGLLRFVTPQTVIADSGFAQSPNLSLIDPLVKRQLVLLRALRKRLPWL